MSVQNGRSCETFAFNFAAQLRASKFSPTRRQFSNQHITDRNKPKCPRKGMHEISWTEKNPHFLTNGPFSGLHSTYGQVQFGEEYHLWIQRQIMSVRLSEVLIPHRMRVHSSELSHRVRWSDQESHANLLRELQKYPRRPHIDAGGTKPHGGM